jgi:hypothetical protein
MDNEKVSFGKRCYAVGKDYRAVYTLAQAILGKGETLDIIHIPEQIDFRVKPEDLKV